MARSLLPRKKPKAILNEPPLWKNPYILAVGGSCFILLCVIGYHLFEGRSVVVDKPLTEKSSSSVFSTFFGRSIYSSKEPLELTDEEMDIIGVPKEQRRTFRAKKPENFREKRRMFAMQKHLEINKQSEERRQAMVQIYQQRNSNVGLGLRDAIEALNDSDNLGIMKLEGLLTDQLADARPENSDTLIFGFISLGNAYVKKGMKQKARDSFLNALKLMKDNSQLQSDLSFSQSYDELTRAQVSSAESTSLGN